MPHYMNIVKIKYLVVTPKDIAIGVISSKFHLQVVKWVVGKNWLWVVKLSNRY